jgi:hypothetical protein
MPLSNNGVILMSYSKLQIRFADNEVDTIFINRLGDHLPHATSDGLKEVFSIFIIYYFNINFL